MGSGKPSIGIFMARAERTFYMARKLRERGFEVVHYNTTRYKDDPYVKIRGGFPAALAYLLLQTNHDVYFTSLSFVPSLSLYLNKLIRRKPYVFNATGVKWQMFKDRSYRKPFSNFLEHRFYPFLLERTYAGASKIVCNSRFLESSIALQYPQYQDRLLTIYNGIDFERYTSGRRQMIPGIGEGDFILVCVTALNFENKSKGLELVLDAFGQVWARRPETKLVVAAKTSNGRYQSWAEEHLKSRPWRDSVILYFNHPNIPNLLASGNIFLYATPDNSNDSLPRALLEAQLAGLPAVTTDTTGCPEIVRDRITGLVVPYEATAMAQGISKLMDSPQMRRNMGREAQKWILDTFNWDQMADRYANVFLEVAG